MSYNLEKYIKMLELDKVLETLSSLVSIDDAAEMAINIKPCFDYNSVAADLKKTDDAYVLTAKYAAPSFGKPNNMNSALSRADVGASLSIKELIDIADLLRIIRSVKEWRNNCHTDSVTSIDYLFNSLSPNKYLEDKINFAIKNEEELNDNASPLLSDLRRKIHSKSEKIRSSLEKLVKGSSSKFLQDSIITQRDGRFVVPVKSEYKGEVSGIVHDTSATGQTLFIEPMPVVEVNNEIRVLKLKEQEEILRILAELSSEASDFSGNIKQSYFSLTELNLIFAKASLAYKMKAVLPKINSKGYIHLKNARHPLINAKSVVPISLSLGKDYNSLIITGPNTGGKTVSLKTVGLLSMMAMCGLFIPADDSSEIAIFDHIFADIGDEQSIEQSLSTFSSHMVNIISILEECDNNSLVLFDELCAGTDPVEGAALAKAILMKISALGGKAVATTHYPELKAYAIDTSNVENASCEFDVDTLKPTYRLIIGTPGRSNAFAISRRLGLDDGVISVAKEQVAEDDKRFERVVASLENARQLAENEKREATRLRAELANSKIISDKKEAEYKAEQEKIMAKTKEKADAIIDSARYKSSLILNELEEIKKQFNANNASGLLDKAKSQYNKTIRDMEKEIDPVTEGANNKRGLDKPPNKGDTVIICDINRDATVLEVNNSDKKAYVMSGIIKMWVSFDNLAFKSAKSSKSDDNLKKARNITGLKSKAERSISGDIDIRGMASDEALLELDSYIDNAVLSGITTVTIIHGKGTGVLRKAVQQHLRSHKCIRTYRTGLYGEGENGVTIAELKE